VAVQRADADTCIAGDRLQRRVGAIVREGSQGDLEQPVPIALGIGSQPAGLGGRQGIPPSTLTNGATSGYG
jgi:hypothetical protein